MITLLLLACGDKDDVRDPSTDTADVVDTGEVGDTGEPAELSCTLGGVSPLTVPIDEEVEVTATLDCNVDASVVEVTLEGEAVGVAQDGDEVALSFSVTRPGRYYLSFQVAGKNPASGTTWMETPVHGHDEVDLSLPDSLVALEEPGQLLSAGETIWVLTDDEVVEHDLQGQVVQRLGHRWRDLDTPSCTAMRPILVCGDVTTTSWIDTATAKEGEYTLAEGSFVDVVPYDGSVRGVAELPVEATPDSSGTTGSLKAIDLGTGQTWDLGRLEGDVRVLGDTVVENACSKHGTVTLTEVTFEGGKAHSSTETSVACGGDWDVVVMDLDDDGEPDQVHTFGDDTGTDIVARLGGRGLGSLYGRISTREIQTLNVILGRIVTNDDGVLFASELEVDETSVTLTNPTYVGPASGVVAPMAAVYPPDESPLVMGADGEALYLAAEGSWLLAADGASELTRTRDDGVAFFVDGVEVGGLPEAGVHGLYDGHVVTVTLEDLTIDEREMTTGGEWDVVQPVGNAVGGQLWLARGSEEAGLGLTLLDLNDPDSSEEALQGNPVFVAKLNPQTTSERLVGLFEAYSDGNDEVPRLGGLLEHDDRCELVLLSGSEPEVEVLATEATCDELPRPLGTVDLYGDGEPGVLLTNGRLLGRDSVGCILKFGPTEVYDRVVGGGDFNGDELDDFVAELDGELKLFLSAGDGTGLDHAETVPAWMDYARAVGVGPGQLTNVRSWAPIVD